MTSACLPGIEPDRGNKFPRYLRPSLRDENQAESHFFVRRTDEGSLGIHSQAAGGAGLRDSRCGDRLRPVHPRLSCGVSGMASVRPSLRDENPAESRPDLLISQVVIPRLHREMADNLEAAAAAAEFLPRLRSRRSER